MRVLIIEDDPRTADYVRKGLHEAGHTVDHAAQVVEGEFLATSESFDVIVVDRMLGAADGLELLDRLRARGVVTPVLILSALGKVDDRIIGLQRGADDYLAKPFVFAELNARVEALGRRSATPVWAKVLRVDDLELDLSRRRVTRAGRPLEIQPREFRLLEYLMRHCDQVVTRTMLLENVWDYHFDPQTNVIDVHVSRLRQKIDHSFARPLIHTVRGAGYMLSAHP
ncbi:response regulator transcription factor [Candidimonas sp. SYP-B2681]|uniref:response regulator transcription factor n=1 Tax=Candidimonas sp. SYP-B2681 TaxID=2497686 RepID=UPI000F87D700|nr:response regulator transcription factor [Candidimonas sp. SYP-B2681]RTZ48019.1 response regulator transcription factor [Candidimonas sp. SYP-B2681]